MVPAPQHHGLSPLPVPSMGARRALPLREKPDPPRPQAGASYGPVRKKQKLARILLLHGA
jgi:hypothetical protein